MSSLIVSGKKPKSPRSDPCRPLPFANPRFDYLLEFLNENSLLPKSIFKFIGLNLGDRYNYYGNGAETEFDDDLGDCPN
jgi:hypothetical protein